jgi:hypothetical protein
MVNDRVEIATSTCRGRTRSPGGTCRLGERSSRAAERVGCVALPLRRHERPWSWHPVAPRLAGGRACASIAKNSVPTGTTRTARRGRLRQLKAGSTWGGVLALQRSVGNAAVSSLLARQPGWHPPARPSEGARHEVDGHQPQDPDIAPKESIAALNVHVARSSDATASRFSISTSLVLSLS